MRRRKAAPFSFTHVDPFEDTERSFTSAKMYSISNVSPTSIRSRILKVKIEARVLADACVVSPTSIRSRILKVSEPGLFVPPEASFTHVDPFEDTESELIRTGV